MLRPATAIAVTAITARREGASLKRAGQKFGIPQGRQASLNGVRKELKHGPRSTAFALRLLGPGTAYRHADHASAPRQTSLGLRYEFECRPGKAHRVTRQAGH